MELRRGMRAATRKVGFRFGLFAKMNALIILLLLAITIMYAYSNDVTFKVVSKELQMSNTRQLTFLSSQIDSRINQMMDFVLNFSRDPNVRKFNGIPIWEDRHDKMQTRYLVQEKMMLQSGIINIWPVRYTVYSQQNKEVISNYYKSAKYTEEYLKRNMTGKWMYGNGEPISADNPKAFYWFFADSFDQQGTLNGSDLVIEASFTHENIQNMLDSYKAGGQGNPIFYHKGETPILNRSATQLPTELIDYLDKQSLEDTTQHVVRLEDEQYLVSTVKSSYLDWHLVDVVPLDQILKPIELSRNLFYLSMVLLFVVGIISSVLLYRNVQRPIRQLIKGLQSVQRGNFSVRINSNENNEFSFLFHRFNDMSHQIQDLIENVINEKIRAREAILKQLQAQINPHFLYNCLGYIINMAQMKDEEAVVTMAYNLSAYYRYTTRIERPTATLDEEVQLIINYLDIQKLRNGRIHYHIAIPEEMRNQRIPRLLVQPIVENAVIHGIGKSYSSGEIRISGEISDGYCKIYIDDDGPGLNEELMNELNHKMREPLKEDVGFGLWNTNQRIIHLFGGKSHLHFKNSPLGGFRTEIIWEMPIDTEQQSNSITRRQTTCK